MLDHNRPAPLIDDQQISIPVFQEIQPQLMLAHSFALFNRICEKAKMRLNVSYLPCLSNSSEIFNLFILRIELETLF